MLFLYCGLPSAPSNLLQDQMTSYILSKCVPFLHCGWACDFSDVQLDQMTSGIEYKWNSSSCCGLPCASSDPQIGQMTSHIQSTCPSFLFCGRVDDSPFLFDLALTLFRHSAQLRLFDKVFTWITWPLTWSCFDWRKKLSCLYFHHFYFFRV